MTAPARTRLAEAIAQAISSDGLSVDRRRLAEAIGVAGEDDPLVIILEAVSLAVDARAQVGAEVGRMSAALDAMLTRHGGRIAAAEGKLLDAILKEEQQRVAFVKALDTRLDELADAQEELTRSGRQIYSTVMLVQARIRRAIIWWAVSAFAVGALGGAWVWELLHRGH